MAFTTIVHQIADFIVRRFPGETLPTLWNGEWIWVPRTSWESVYRTYEPYMSRILRTYLQSGGCFIDVGAHFGWWSLFAAARVGSDGRVLALEPSVAYELLSANVKAYPQITVVQVGAGAETGSATFFGQGIATSGSFVAAVTAINQQYSADSLITPLVVSISTLDELTSMHKLQPSLVKVDVEGFEVNVLDGSKRLLETGIPFVIEIHPLQLTLSGHTPEMVYTRLTRFGYNIEVIDRNPNGICTILAKREKP